MHTAKLNSAVGCTLRSLTPQWGAHRGVWLRGGNHTAEFFEKFGAVDSVVRSTPRSLTQQRCDAQSDSAVGCTVHTAEFFEKFWSLNSVVWGTPRSLTPQWDAHRGAWLCRMIHTEESDFAGWCTPQRQTLRRDAHRGAFKKFEYLSEIETEFENILACLSGFESWKKNWGRKSRDTLQKGSQVTVYI